MEDPFAAWMARVRGEGTALGGDGVSAEDIQFLIYNGLGDKGMMEYARFEFCIGRFPIEVL